jgi:hypothetical protein
MEPCALQVFNTAVETARSTKRLVLAKVSSYNQLYELAQPRGGTYVPQGVLWNTPKNTRTNERKYASIATADYIHGRDLDVARATPRIRHGVRDNSTGHMGPIRAKEKCSARRISSFMATTSYSVEHFLKLTFRAKTPQNDK